MSNTTPDNALERRDFDEPVDDEIERVQVDASVLIAEAMRKEGWRQADLAQALDVDPSLVSKYLSGERNLTLSSLARIMFALGVQLHLTGRRENGRWLTGPPLGRASMPVDRDPAANEAGEALRRQAAELVARLLESAHGGKDRISDATEIDAPALSMIARGDRDVTVEQLGQIAGACGETVSLQTAPWFSKHESESLGLGLRGGDERQFMVFAMTTKVQSYHHQDWAIATYLPSSPEADPRQRAGRIDVDHFVAPDRSGFEAGSSRR